MHYIYELIDPRTNEVRYVGASNDPKMRYSHHLGRLDGGAEKIAWLKELAELKLKPILNIRESHEDRNEALLRETYWITQHLSEGQRLVNIKHGRSPSWSQVSAKLQISIDFILDLYDVKATRRTRISEERYQMVQRSLARLHTSTIRDASCYSLEELFNELRMNALQLAYVLDVPERTITRFREGKPTDARRVALLLRFFSWMYQQRFTLKNVTGINIDGSKNPFVLRRLMLTELDILPSP